MPITEFAILGLRHGHDEPALLETLAQCQELQDAWMRRNQPGGVEHDASLSSMYLERLGPDHTPASSLLITAPWESAEAHGEWIRCNENQACNDKLSDYIVPGSDSVLLFHMEPAGVRAQIRGGFNSRATFNVCRISVDVGQRDSLQNAYRSFERDLLDEGGVDHAWAGWKMEASGDSHDFVVFWSDEVSSERLRPLMSFSDNKSHQRFRHVV